LWAESAQAGFFDLLGNKAEAVGKATPAGNSQTIGLQSFAVSNLAALGAFGGGENTVVAGSALLPDAGPSGTIVDIKEPTTDQISLYVVRQGDSLSAIAEMYGVSVNTIAWANNMSVKTPLKEGQTLVILPVSGVRHTVAKGETIASIAKKYKGDAEEITQFNGLEAGKLAVGETIIIPNGEVTPAAGSKTNPIRGGGPVYAGYYIRPTKGVKTQGLHGYNGVDIGAPLGTEILAAAAGRVIVSRADGWNGGYGNYIVVEHANKTQTLYSHLSKNLVSVGQSVAQGEVIGLMGSTGRSTGSHLHFEVRGARNPF
jgi:murein DD-endopeptidase MepM/ murein hydrolase activator NlpD